MNKSNFSGWNAACVFVATSFTAFSTGVLYKDPQTLLEYLFVLLFSLFISVPGQAVFAVCHMPLPEDEDEKPSLITFILVCIGTFAFACLFCGVIV